MWQAELGLSGGRGRTPVLVAPKAKAGPTGGHVEGVRQISGFLSGPSPLVAGF